MKTNHPEELLSRYVDNELTEGERHEVSEHLASCESCRLSVEELRALRVRIREAADVSLPENFVYSVLRSARAEQENTVVWLSTERLARNVVVVLSVLVLTLVGLGTFLRPEPAIRVDRYLITEPTDTLVGQVLGTQGEISKDVVVYAVLTK
jgi:anti-sigma factor RsiW